MRNNSPGREVNIKNIIYRVAAIALSIAAILVLYSSLSESGEQGQAPAPREQASQWRPIEQPPEEEASQTDDQAEPGDTLEVSESYPAGQLLLSAKRGAYVGGSMTLEIPRLGLTAPVLDGTDTATLDSGVCLFEYAQLPGITNANTVIVAHRDIYGSEFYYIDQLTEGDLLYLEYEGKRYTYEFADSFITHDSDWDPIKTRDYTSITLQSCDPIGTSLNRIFVVGRLIETEDVG